MRTTENLIKSYLKDIEKISLSKDDKFFYKLSNNRLLITIIHSNGNASDIDISLLDYLTYLFNKQLFIYLINNY